MTNAYAQAQKMAREKAEGTTCFVPLSLLQDLLDEIDRLQAQLPKPESVGDVVKNFPKEKRDG